jgi:hypothetical protein
MKHENRTPLFIFLGTLHRPAGHNSNTQKMKKKEKENTNDVPFQKSSIRAIFHIVILYLRGDTVANNIYNCL